MVGRKMLATAVARRARLALWLRLSHRDVRTHHVPGRADSYFPSASAQCSARASGHRPVPIQTRNMGFGRTVKKRGGKGNTKVCRDGKASFKAAAKNAVAKEGQLSDARS